MSASEASLQASRRSRHRRLITPYSASLTVGKSEKHESVYTAKADKQSTLFDDDFSCDAVPESTGPSLEMEKSKSKMIDTSSAFYLRAKGRLVNKDEEKEKDKAKEKSKSLSGSVSKSGNKDKSYNSGVFPPNPKNNVEVFGPDNKKLKSRMVRRQIRKR